VDVFMRAELSASARRRAERCSARAAAEQIADPRARTTREWCVTNTQASDSMCLWRARDLAPHLPGLSRDCGLWRFVTSLTPSPSERQFAILQRRIVMGISISSPNCQIICHRTVTVAKSVQESENDMARRQRMIGSEKRSQQVTAVHSSSQHRI